MDAERRQQIKDEMQMLVVVPLDELGGESLGVFDAPEEFRIDYLALHGREDAFRKGIVVARARPAKAGHHVRFSE